MKTMLISSNSEMGFGADIEQHFSADCYSRSCGGYDIDKMEGRLRIAKASLDYDVVVVHAYTNNGGQIAMLEQLVKTWIDKEHAGHILLQCNPQPDMLAFVARHRPKGLRWSQFSKLTESPKPEIPFQHLPKSSGFPHHTQLD